MIIYGTKTFDLKTASFPFACTDCGYEQQQVRIHRTFFSLYYIPLIPFRKSARICCPMCFKEVKKNKFFKELASKINPAEAKFQLKSILKSARTPFHAVAASYLAVTLFAGAMTYFYFDDQKNQYQAKVYTQNPTENVIGIAKINDTDYPFQMMFIPEIHGELVWVFDGKHGYKTSGDAKNALKSVLNSISNKKIKNNFFEPVVVPLKDFQQIEFVYVHALDKKID